MPTAGAVQTDTESAGTGPVASGRGALRRLARQPVLRELLIFVGFCAMTAAVTWPYVTRMRDAVVDPGDPYLVAWILWWDYHQTFTDPLNLFHANLFYPLRYTLAFSEHSYGIALPFFPLFALGARPLTVHSVALFFGFVTCGYGAFRLTRTLTGSTGAAWVSGIVFAFVPFRFGMMSHLPYLFSAWIPLLLEALVLFTRKRTKKRAVWLGFAFFMTGLTTISWFVMSLVPLAVSAAILLTRYRLWRDREFWRRGAVALGAGTLALLPFLLPYYMVAKLYNLKRGIQEVKSWSAWPSHWLAADSRNKLWHGLGDNLPDGGKFRLFPGALPILLSLAALLLVGPSQGPAPPAKVAPGRNRWVKRLDGIALVALVLSIPAIGYAGTGALGGLYGYVTSERVLALFTVAVIARLCLAYPAFLPAGNLNLIETLRSERRSEAFWLGLALTTIGFCYSLGWNFFFYRILYDVLPVFKSMRVAVRGSMFAYLGLAILAGLGAKRLSEIIRDRKPRVRPAVVYAVLAAMLLLELNGARLKFMRGDVYPDGVTVRLKETPMRGGVVVLPAGPNVNHRHVLRSADHMKPLIVGISGFGSPYEDRIEWATRSGPIPQDFIDFLEEVPTSYVVVENNLIPPARRADYEAFFARGVASGRLIFIQRFDSRSDLYAVVKTEPEAKSETPLPFESNVKGWETLLNEDPVYLLGQYQDWSMTVYRFYVASYGELPRFNELLPDMRAISRGVVASLSTQETTLSGNVREFATRWVGRDRFKSAYANSSDEEYIERLSANTGAPLDDVGRASLVQRLSSGELTRHGALLEIVNDPRFVEREKIRALVLLHYFGYLRRNPDDPPDNDLRGMRYWIEVLQRDYDPDKLTLAFNETGEYQQFKRGSGRP